MTLKEQRQNEAEEERFADRMNAKKEDENYCICPECGETTDEDNKCPIICQNCGKHLDELSSECFYCVDCDLHYIFGGELRCIPCSEDDLSFMNLSIDTKFDAVTAAPIIS